MAILTTAQVKQYLQTAGFTGNGLSSGTIIVQKESGNNTLAVNQGDPYGGSYGMWQINGSHIVELFGTSITLAQAYDPQASSNYAYQLSNGGSDFSAWAAGAGLPVSSNKNSSTVTSNVATNQNVYTMTGSGYTFVFSYLVVILILVFISKTRIGYVSIYYLLILTILLLFVTQAQFIASAIANITQGN